MKTLTEIGFIIGGLIMFPILGFKIVLSTFILINLGYWLYYFQLKLCGRYL